MIHLNKQLRITVKLKDQRRITLTPQDTRYASYSIQEEEVVGGKRLRVFIEPAVALWIENASIEWTQQVKASDRLFFNGYQSWTDAQELTITDRMPSLRWFAKPLVKKYQFDKYGDRVIGKFSHRKGDFHGFSYCYLKGQDSVSLVASLNEHQGFTILTYQNKKHVWTARKDLEGVVMTSKTCVFDLLFTTGTMSEVFDQYAHQLQIPRIENRRYRGWTSWYNYYQNISEEIILKNLSNYDHGQIDIFQIDDGYQMAIGDWLDVDKKKFPKGMKYLADQIHAKGVKAGIWLAPFVTEKKSSIAKNHPEWLIKDEQGNFLEGGSNWSGFYVLNLELDEVKSYLRHVFSVVLDEWGYDMVKLDFLYALCILPTVSKSRGQIMAEGMDFLRECVGNRLILGCGVPLASSFGKVDFCRIGCDVGLDYNDKWFMKYFHRERISTYHAINNAIGRYELNGRFFLNDPDVFLLRDANLELTDAQKTLLAKVNQWFGKILFTSDDISLYSDEAMHLYQNVMDEQNIEIDLVTTLKKGVYKVLGRCNGVKTCMYINSSDVLYQNSEVTLPAYQLEMREQK